MIDQLKTIGIEKGKPFQPDAKTTAVLKGAAEEARALFDLRYETTYEPHNQGTRWFLPADRDLTDSIQSGFTKTDIYPTDGRGTTSSTSRTARLSIWARASSISSSAATRTATRSTAPRPIACTCRPSRR